jgi:hypothetical protein
MNDISIPAASAERERSAPNPGTVVVGINVRVSVTGGVTGDSVTIVVGTGD